MLLKDLPAQIYVGKQPCAKIGKFFFLLKKTEKKLLTVKINFLLTC
jgi:hypothetical protein